MRRPLVVALAASLLLSALLRFSPHRELFTPPPRPVTRVLPPPPLVLLFVGDVMLARSVGARMAASGDWSWPFRRIQPLLRQADLVFGNLECPVSDTGRDLHHLYSFRADPRALEGLSHAGFRVVSVANNHMDDWDRPALLDTVRRLRGAGIVPVGAGADQSEARSSQVVALNGARIAFLAYVDVDPKDAAAGPEQAGVAWLNPEDAVADVRAAKPLADVVVVSLHWGVEYARQPSAEQVKLAHRLVDAGADLVVGAHPHVVQPFERYLGGYVAYSLGNFVFDQKDALAHRGLMLEAVVRNRRLERVTPVPLVINTSFQPGVDDRPGIVGVRLAVPSSARSK